MWLSILALVLGIVVLLYSADVFVDGASEIAKYFNISAFLIGMLIVGFGTSAPEMVVSFVASLGGNSGIAIGNAYGSNISNIALILGLTAIVKPIKLNSNILKKELPILAIISFIAIYQMLDEKISRLDATVLLLLFLCFVLWSTFEALKKKNENDSFTSEVKNIKTNNKNLSLTKSFLKILFGITFLVLSSKSLVWGATNIAVALHVSELVIGLTIIAIGTSLPELATSIVATKKNEHDIAFGNIIGSNIFNTLAVVGIAGITCPFEVSEEVLKRDMMFMIVLTLSLFIIGCGFKGKAGKINRVEGSLLFISYIIYLCFLIKG